MKRIRSIALLLCLALIASGCGGKTGSGAEAQQPSASSPPAASAQPNPAEPEKTEKPEEPQQAPEETPEPEEWYYDAYDKVTVVDSTDAFLSAVADGAVIVLQPGTYDVSEWMLAHELPEWNCENVDENPTGLIVEYNQLVVNGIANLTILAADLDAKTEIVCDYADVQVFSFWNCHNIVFNGITMGHAIEPGYCSGDVLGMTNCSNVTISDCDLYGCGAYALNLLDCFEVNVYSSVIRDCTYGCAVIQGTEELTFHDTVFRDCEQFSMFEITFSAVEFDRCEFKNLCGNMIYSNGVGSVRFEDCTFDMAAAESLQKNPYYNDVIEIF